MKKIANDVMDKLGRFRERLRSPSTQSRNERRSCKRVSLRIPIRVRLGESQPFSTRLYDISPNGLCFEGDVKGRPGDLVWIRFDGYPGVCDSFVLAAEVARLTNDPPARIAVKINRERSRKKVLGEYHKLVLHYLRHRPLLEKKQEMFVEGRCSTCDWVGRVSVRKPVCSRCGLLIKDLIG